MTEPLLAVDRLHTGYSGAAVVRDLSIEVAAGEVVALLGANGAGKTTTLLTISGLVEPMAGELKLFGRPVGERAPHQLAGEGLAHVLENRSLFYQLSVRENLQMGAGRKSKIDGALDHFPALRPLLDRRAGLLSGGEQQMLAIGRAIAARPRLLLVDEMSLGLAPLIVQAMLPVLRQLADDGAGVLLVEQHIHLALEIADRGLVLANGETVASGSVAELRANRALLEEGYLG